jgi:Ca2+-binding EF-hand superfamily protein
MQLQHQLSDPNLHQSNNAKVYFTDFLRTLQDFQMRQHESYLKGFTRLFRRADTDSDGILNEEQFISLMDKEL